MVREMDAGDGQSPQNYNERKINEEKYSELITLLSREGACGHEYRL